MREATKWKRAGKLLEPNSRGVLDYDGLYELGIPGRAVLFNMLSNLKDGASLDNLELIASKNGHPDRVGLKVGQVGDYRLPNGIATAESLSLNVLLGMPSDEDIPVASLAISYNLANQSSEDWSLSKGVARYSAPVIRGIVSGPFDSLRPRVRSDYESALTDSRAFVLSTAQRVLDEAGVSIMEYPILALPEHAA